MHLNTNEKKRKKRKKEKEKKRKKKMSLGIKKSAKKVIEINCLWKQVKPQQCFRRLIFCQKMWKKDWYEGKSIF